VPFHNEEENVTELYDRLKNVMETTGETFEMVFVDDGSRDLTFVHLQEIAAVDRRRGRGQTPSQLRSDPSARSRLRQCCGEYVIAMDGDLQHDPNDIPLFLEKLEKVTTSSAAGVSSASIIS